MSNFLTSHPWLIVIAVTWSLIWKGIALWKSARTGDKVWYIVLLIVNTLGLLEILYIFVFRRREEATFKPKEEKG